MQVELFTFEGSNACRSVELLLDHAGIEWRRRGMRPGFHALELRARGFRRQTAPAAIIDGERVQGSRHIAHAVADAMPELGLLPDDPDLREVVLEAERDAERLQNAARRLMYVLAQDDASVIRPLVDANFRVLPGPARSVFARVLVRAASYGHAARRDRVDGYLQVVADVVARLDELVEDGVLGTDTPTVADFQATPNLAALAMVGGLGDAVRARPSWRIAERIESTYPITFTLDAPADWSERLLD